MRDLNVTKYGVIGSAIVMRSGAAVPASGCVRYQGGNGPALPSVGAVTAANLSFSTALSCNTTTAGVPETRCLKNGASPIPVAGSTLDTFTYLGASAPTLGVTGGGALGAASASPALFDGGVQVLSPASLARDAGTDLVVTWSPAAAPTLVEVEVFDGGVGIVLCAPSTSGTLTIPADLISGRVDRLTVSQFSEATATDAQSRTAKARVYKGTVLSP